MPERTLNRVQLASLLVSTSCGIGFLLGTAELAMRQGIVGSLYAVASALGLTMLALYAPALWKEKRTIWSGFDQSYGTSVGRSVALLSLVWMTGVLAAQIRGGLAMLALMGLSRSSALLLIDCALIGVSLLRFSWLSAGFAICMLGCCAILMRSLIETGGLVVWLNAPVNFFDALRSIAPVPAGFTAMSIVVMVICGADYQQFVLAARSPATARAGCLLAAVLVFAIGFLPAVAVLAAAAVWHLDGLSNPVQVIPVLLIRTLSIYAKNATPGIVIFILSATVLGAGCSVLRAMSDATAAYGPRSVTHPIWSRIFPVAASSLVAMRGQTLVDTMIDLNMVYIAAVGPLLGLKLFGVSISGRSANATMASGCIIAITCYLIRWTGVLTIPAASTLLVSLPVSFLVATVFRPHPANSSGTSENIPPLID